ncbi:MAG: cysteine peptidase family C39 domain-containing protein, partial [Planctomycetota bacterium]
VVVKYDGSRFYWEVNVNSRSDSVRPGADLASNSMTRQFRSDWNGRRVFAWDGRKYSLYSRSANNAIVDASSSTPRAVNGPLTAGIIPWGYGRYTYASLSAWTSSATETVVDRQTQIHLTLSKSDGSEMGFVLDADKDYAVISHSTHGSAVNIFRQYGSFQTVSDSLVPTIIVIEQYDASTNRLLASDLWDFTSISGRTPGAGEFSIDYEDDAMIEYRSTVAASPAIYRRSEKLNTELLLAERLTFAASQDKQAQNCATAALRYATLRLGKNISDRQLSQLVKGPKRQTSLRAMKEFVHGQGLHCRAVKTDIRTLRGLTDCQVILHLPAKSHFVLVGDIDDASVWCIDLASRRFCYQADINFFDMDWTEGTALLISDTPITGAFNDIDDGRLEKIAGGVGYSCTNLLQEDDYWTCDTSGGGCWGAYEYYPERWGCEEAETGMCIDSSMLGLAECACVFDSQEIDCEIDGYWHFYYMTACE